MQNLLSNLSFNIEVRCSSLRTKKQKDWATIDFTNPYQWRLNKFTVDVAGAVSMCRYVQVTSAYSTAVFVYDIMRIINFANLR